MRKCAPRNQEQFVSVFQRAKSSFFKRGGARLKDESLEDSANLPDPDIIAQEIVEDLQAALAQFATIAADLKK